MAPSLVCSVRIVNNGNKTTGRERKGIKHTWSPSTAPSFGSIITLAKILPYIFLILTPNKAELEKGVRGVLLLNKNFDNNI